MIHKVNYINKITYFIILLISLVFLPTIGLTKNNNSAISGNFGLPGIIDLPTARRLPDGELVFTQQIHKSLARTGATFQVLPKLGVSFRYSGHGVGGGEYNGRFNHDRSFDAHLSIMDEGQYLPAISIGLRDFIGTGWYSSEYLVGTKSFGKLEVTAGFGFGRLAGRNSFENPFRSLHSGLKSRGGRSAGVGGTLGSIDWFKGDASVFYGANFKLGQKIIFSAEYTPDLMSVERRYLAVESPWNIGVKYQLNEYINLNAEYLHGSQVSLTANVMVNPARPLLLEVKNSHLCPLENVEEMLTDLGTIMK